ncbi:MAG: hypothetical protein AAGA55_01280 [Planctomycetota bacterium]
MQPTEQQTARITRSLAIVSRDPDGMRTAFVQALEARGEHAPAGSCRIIADLFEIAQTLGPDSDLPGEEAPSPPGHESALLAALERVAGYTWTNRLAKDWQPLVRLVIQRSSAVHVAA